MLHCSKDKGRFPFNQNFRKFANSCLHNIRFMSQSRRKPNFPEKFPWNPENANHSTDNSRYSWSKVEWNENIRENVFENSGIPRDVVLDLIWEILENALISIERGNPLLFSIHYWKLPKIQTRLAIEFISLFSLRFKIKAKIHDKLNHYGWEFFSVGEICEGKNTNQTFSVL